MRHLRSVFAVLVLLTPLFLSVPALAQNSAQESDTDSGVGIGVLGGLNRTSIRGDEGEGIEAGNGPMVGIWFGGNRNGRVGFMGELSYLERRSSAGGFETKIKYLEIPAVFRINVGSRSRDAASVYGLIGPVFDFKMSESFEGISTDDNFKGVDVGILGGIGVEVNRVGFEVRGNWGLKNINQGDVVVSDIKTFSLQILGKFRFN
jgi:hypothetical protein